MCFEVDLNRTSKLKMREALYGFHVFRFFEVLPSLAFIILKG